MTLRGLLGWLPFSRWKWRVVETVEAADEVPDRIPRRGAVLVAQDGMPSWVVFDCPCNRGHRIMINLHPSRSPAWRLVNPAKLTLWPSVDDITSDRRCHFFARDGRISWVKNREGGAR